ncbi:UbiA family prenyltransferase [Methanosphaerula subterraneus]|uniref:UbiA family prenyltransferase n=1 Tax=Methanosphaerula subterraneus TaxID=3350244 RepID=UPI003F85ECF5
MRLSIGTKIRASADLIRMDLALGAGIFFVAGGILALGGVPPLNQVLFGFLTIFFISGSANISNDYFDRDVDRINLPARPLPSGRIAVPELWALFFLFTAAGLMTAALLGPLVLALVAVLWGIALLYNIKLKNSGFAGNLVVAVCVAMTVLLGGITAGTINGLLLTFAALAFFFDLGEEIASDAMDVEGDRLRSSKSLAKRWGRTAAIRIAGVVFAAFCLLTLLPFVLGWLGYDYLFLGAVMDLWTISCWWRLARARTVDEGREQVRRLYLARGLFVVVSVITRIR